MTVRHLLTPFDLQKELQDTEHTDPLLIRGSGWNPVHYRDNEHRKIELNIKYDCRTVPSHLTPELSVIDYLLWALQRYILSDDNRYYLESVYKHQIVDN